MANQMDFGSWLRQARTARGQTQEALAEAVGCATQTLRSLEIGRRRPSREMAARIAAVLGVPPEERDGVLALARAPLAAPAPGAAPTPELPAGPAPAPPRLAAPPATLIGRQQELARLRKALLDEGRRIVTLIGPGGIGKTSLALQVAGELADQFADGAAFVALAPVSEPANLATAIAEAVGCPLAGSRMPDVALREFVRDRELLLILDNLDQLLAPGGQAVALLADLLAAGPGVRLLATSRERLHLRGERVIVVDGLPVADDRPGAAVEQAPATLLFLDRAQQADPAFALTRQNRGAVARICRLLGGVPLALELAASWVRVLSPAEIAEQVAHDAGALSAPGHDLPERHRSLRTVLDHSWQLLAPAERRLLAHLAAFRGGCRREAIAAVLGEADAAGLLAHLAALVDRSVVRRALDADGATRYDLHEFVRQYAAAHLAEESVAAEVAARHAAHYAAWAAAQEAALKSERQRPTLEALVAEIANLRAAWDWACAARDASLLRQMLPTLDWLYELRGWYDEARASFARAAEALREPAARPDAAELTRACYWLVYGRVGFHTLRRDPPFAVRRLAESVAALRQVSRSGEQIHCLKGLAYVRMFGGDYATAEALLDEGRAIAESRDDRWNLAMTLVIRGVMEALRSEPAVARGHLAAALAVARGVGDPRPVAQALTYLALVALALGEPQAAAPFAREAYLLAAAHQDRFQTSLALQALGRVALARGEHGECRWLFDEALAIAREIGDRWLEAQALGCLAALAAERGDLGVARAGRRAALSVAAAAPPPVALDELAALAALELDERPAAALAALAYVRHHPLARPAARAMAERHWLAAAERAAPGQLAAAEAAAAALPAERPAALLDLLGLQ
ncbi:MAG TPA: helix-turn-helix domain-containing protein [Chloroflexaceae bacterium]|nr:helix-turn-helix domain-containing protein [Chloroflexaceae bacterium]